MTGGPAPVEWIEYVLCRYVFRCRPSELRAEAAEDIQAILVCMSMEKAINKALQ